MTREDARYYLRSSGFSEEQINTIEQAFKQEPCADWYDVGRKNDSRGKNKKDNRIIH